MLRAIIKLLEINVWVELSRFGVYTACRISINFISIGCRFSLMQESIAIYRFLSKNPQYWSINLIIVLNLFGFHTTVYTVFIKFILSFVSRYTALYFYDIVVHLEGYCQFQVDVSRYGWWFHFCFYFFPFLYFVVYFSVHAYINFYVVMLHCCIRLGEDWRLLKRLNPLYLFAPVLSQEPVVSGCCSWCWS